MTPEQLAEYRRKLQEAQAHYRAESAEHREAGRWAAQIASDNKVGALGMALRWLDEIVRGGG